MVGTAGPSWLQGYSVLCNIMVSKKSWGDWWVGWKVPIAWDCWASFCLWELVSGGKHHLVVFLLWFPLCWINCVYLDPYISLLFLFSPMSHRCGSWVSRGCKISICCLGLSHYRVHNHSNISFCICNYVFLNMVFKETSHCLSVWHYLNIHVGISSPKLDLEKQLYCLVIKGRVVDQESWEWKGLDKQCLKKLCSFFSFNFQWHGLFLEQMKNY